MTSPRKGENICFCNVHQTFSRLFFWVNPTLYRLKTRKESWYQHQCSLTLVSSNLWRFLLKKTETKSSRNFHVPSSYCRLHTRSQILTQHKFYDNFQCLFKFCVHAQQHSEPPQTFLLVCMERVQLICFFHVACCSLIESMFHALLCILTESTQRPLLHRLAHKQNRADAQSAALKYTWGFSKNMVQLRRWRVG